MTRVHFTSDLHLGHRRVAELRGFSVADHDDAIERQWRIHVRPDDIVWILGDLTLQDPRRYTFGRIREWPGRKRLILGNHDHAHPFFRDAPTRLRQYFPTFEYVATSQRIRLGGDRQEFLLSHFPYLGGGDHTADERYNQWRLPNLGLPLLHGHTHSSTIWDFKYPNQFHVGLDAWQLRPARDGEILDYFAAVPVTPALTPPDSLLFETLPGGGVRINGRDFPWVDHIDSYTTTGKPIQYEVEVIPGQFYYDVDDVRALEAILTPGVINWKVPR